MSAHARFPSVAAVAALCALAAPGCYLGRLTPNFSKVPFASEIELSDAMVEETGQDEESAARNERRLLEIELEDDEVYKINAGDLIEIRVYGHDDLGMLTRIGPDGCIGFAFMGQVKLSDKTLSEAADAIRDGLAPYVKNPVVSITLKEVMSETATIAGACAKPGVYQISNSTRLADLYAMAGSSADRLFNGVDVDIADLEHSMLVRGDEIIPVDFRKAINEGVRRHNVRLHKGDYVFIAQRMEASVTVCGEVRSPHRRLYEEGLGLVETLSYAGWMKDTHWKNVIVIRGGLSDPKMFKVDVDGILAGRSRNVKLEPNDIVYVPKDDLAEFNVFVQKLLPTAQISNLLRSNVTGGWSIDSSN